MASTINVPYTDVFGFIVPSMTISRPYHWSESTNPIEGPEMTSPGLYRKAQGSLTALAMVLLCMSGRPEAAVSGTVTDFSGHGISGVGVSLALAGISTISDASGAWSMTATGIDAHKATKSPTRWTGKAVELTLAEPSTVLIEVYDLKGASIGRLATMCLAAGMHTLPVNLAPSGMVWLRVTVNGRVETELTGIGMGSGIRIFRESPTLQIAARSQGMVDTLLFTWKAKIVARTALPNLDTSGIMTAIDTFIFTDARDSQTYKYVTIGSQTWMAQNLNFAPSSGNSWCYHDSVANCLTYGRLYDWATAMGIGTTYNSKTWGGSDVRHQGACPGGWHLPSDSEWTKLTGPAVNHSNTAGTILKSASGWSGSGNNGTDTYGFRVLPAGAHITSYFQGLGDNAYFWSASEDVGEVAKNRYFYGSGDVDSYDHEKSDGYSVRCVQD